MDPEVSITRTLMPKVSYLAAMGGHTLDRTGSTSCIGRRIGFPIHRI